MSQEKTIKLLLKDGTLENQIYVENSLLKPCVLYVFPKKQIKDTFTFECFRSYGIYILISDNMVYIGQSSDISKRIKQHIDGKEWWEKVVIVTTTDNSLNKSDIDYLESTLISKALKVGRLSSDNKNKGNKKKIDRFRKSELDQFINETLFVLNMINIKVFVEKKNAVKITKKSQAKNFLNENGLLISNFTYAILSDSKEFYWTNPKTEFLNQKWDIILNNWNEEKLIHIQVPPFTFKIIEKGVNGIYKRVDKPQYLDIHLYFDTLIERKGRVDFKKYIINEYSYKE